MNFGALLATTDRTLLDSEAGDVVVYTSSEGAAVTVRGMFDRPSVTVEAGEAGVSSSGPAVFLLLGDLPTDPSDDNATVTVSGNTFGIREARPDGKGGVYLLLQEA
jgi:hypothetical protein